LDIERVAVLAKGRDDSSRDGGLPAQSVWTWVPENENLRTLFVLLCRCHWQRRDRGFAQEQSKIERLIPPSNHGGLPLPIGENQINPIFALYDMRVRQEASGNLHT